MFNRATTIRIRIKRNKHGTRIAHYWGTAQRWLPLKIEEADDAIRVGEIFGRPVVVEREEAA
jgi:hypothetical protein